jgi:hypothetical protein
MDPVGFRFNVDRAALARSAASGAAIGALSTLAGPGGLRRGWRHVGLGAATGAVVVSTFVSASYPLALELTRSCTHSACRAVDCALGALGGLASAASILAIARSRMALPLLMAPVLYSAVWLQEDAMLWRFTHTQSWERLVASQLALAPLALHPAPLRALALASPLAAAPQLLISWLEERASERVSEPVPVEAASAEHRTAGGVGRLLAQLSPAQTSAQPEQSRGLAQLALACQRSDAPTAETAAVQGGAELHLRQAAGALAPQSHPVYDFGADGSLADCAAVHPPSDECPLESACGPPTAPPPPQLGARSQEEPHSHAGRGWDRSCAEDPWSAGGEPASDDLRAHELAPPGTETTHPAESLLLDPRAQFALATGARGGAIAAEAPSRPDLISGHPRRLASAERLGAALRVRVDALAQALLSALHAAGLVPTLAMPAAAPAPGDRGCQRQLASVAALATTVARCPPLSWVEAAGSGRFAQHWAGLEGATPPAQLFGNRARVPPEACARGLWPWWPLPEGISRVETPDESELECLERVRGIGHAAYYVLPYSFFRGFALSDLLGVAFLVAIRELH